MLKIIAHLKPVEEQRPELGPLHHEQRHAVTKSGGRGGEVPVRHGLGVDGVDHLSQGFLGARRALSLLHERGELLLHPAAVPLHAAEKIHQAVHDLRPGARRLHVCLFLRQEVEQIKIY